MNLPWNPEMFAPLKQKQSMNVNEHEESNVRQRQTNKQFFKMQSTPPNFLDENGMFQGYLVVSLKIILNFYKLLKHFNFKKSSLYS